MANMTDIIAIIETDDKEIIEEVKRRIKEHNSNKNNYEIGIEFEGKIRVYDYLAIRTTSKWNLENADMGKFFANIEINNRQNLKIFVACFENDKFEAMNSYVDDCFETVKEGNSFIMFESIEELTEECEVFNYAEIDIPDEIRDALGYGNNLYIATWQGEGGFGVLKASRNKKTVIKEIVEDVKKYDKEFNKKLVENTLRSHDYYGGEVCQYKIESLNYWEL